jgi:hypothetical protein
MYTEESISFWMLARYSVTASFNFSSLAKAEESFTHLSYESAVESCPMAVLHKAAAKTAIAYLVQSVVIELSSPD